MATSETTYAPPWQRCFPETESKFDESEFLCDSCQMELIDLSKTDCISNSPPGCEPVDSNSANGPVRTTVNIAFGMLLGQVGWLLASAIF